MENKLPILYLVDSAGVYLPMQDEIFPDEDDFGRIFRNNAVISADGLPQIAAIMGNCVAGGGYLPVMCDTLLMTEGSGLYLAGPALVKAAIGQVASSEELGGAKMHASISGTIDYREPNDELCIERLRRVVGKLGKPPHTPFDRVASISPKRPELEIFNAVAAGMPKAALAGVPSNGDDATKADPALQSKIQNPKSKISVNWGAAQYDVRELLEHLVDADSFDEYKAEYGQSIVCGLARRLGGGRHRESEEAGEAGEGAAAIRLGDLRRFRRQNGAVHPGLQPDEVSAGFSAGRERLYGGPRQRAGRDHPGGREAGERSVELDRAEDHPDHGRIVWSGQLRDVRQGV
jgi:acetyl-CoA carboxylase carboxyltransferase component